MFDNDLVCENLGYNNHKNYINNNNNYNNYINVMFHKISDTVI